MKKLIFLAAVILSLFLLSSCSLFQSKEPVEIRLLIAHDPVKYFEEAAFTFKEIVERESEGTINVSVNATNETIRNRQERLDIRHDSKRMLRDREVEMIQVYTGDLIEYNPKMAALSLPRLFRDYPHIDAVVEGEIGEELMDGLENSPFMGLAFTFSGGFMSFTSLTEEITTLEGLQGKKLLDRNNPVTSVIYEKLGIAADLSDDPRGLVPSFVQIAAANMSDLLETNYDDVLYLLDRNEVDSILHTRHRVYFTSFMMNRDFFESLTKKQQEIVKKAAVEAARKERYAIKATEDQVIANGTYSHFFRELSSEDNEELERTAKQVESELVDLIGQDIINRIRNT